MNVHAGARLDRLPLSGFHRRIMWLIGIGMFFDGFDIYVASTVLGATLKSPLFTYQATLVIFGLASLAAALAPSMPVLIACRFVMGLGLGAENVVGYSTM